MKKNKKSLKYFNHGGEIAGRKHNYQIQRGNKGPAFTFNFLNKQIAMLKSRTQTRNQKRSLGDKTGGVQSGQFKKAMKLDPQCGKSKTVVTNNLRHVRKFNKQIQKTKEQLHRINDRIRRKLMKKFRVTAVPRDLKRYLQGRENGL